MGAQGPRLTGASQNAPRYKFDPDWPKPLPNKWKIGGVIGLGIDKDDNVWVYHRPTDLTSLELEAEVGVSDCCVRPPSMIHLEQGRERARLVRRAAGARHGRRRPWLRVSGAGHRPEVRHANRQVGGRDSPHSRARRRRAEPAGGDRAACAGAGQPRADYALPAAARTDRGTTRWRWRPRR